MTEEDFTFHHLETDEDIEQNLELMRKVFGETSGVDDFVKKLIYHHPTMTLKDFFVIKHHGKIVAGLNLIPLKWNIEGVPLKIAEVGCVATFPKYRRQGLQRKLMNDLHKRAAEQEYDLCAIEGIPYFYRQFGYEYALPLDERTTISLDQIPEYESSLKIRPFTDRDMPQGMQLLLQTQRKFYVHSVRNEQIWRMQQETKMASDYRFDAYAIEDNGKMLAYMRISDKPESKELILREATDTDHRVGKAILKFLKDTGKQRKLETLVSHISHYDSLTEQLVALGAIKNIPPYAWQIRVIDYVKLFHKIKPLFEKHLASSSYCHLTEKLNFNFYRYIVQVKVEDGAITDVHKLDNDEDRIIRANPQIFVQLLLGHKSREELEMTYPDFIIRKSHKHLIDILFPKLPSHIHNAY